MKDILGSQSIESLKLSKGNSVDKNLSQIRIKSQAVSQSHKPNIDFDASAKEQIYFPMVKKADYELSQNQSYSRLRKVKDTKMKFFNKRDPDKKLNDARKSVQEFNVRAFSLDS